MQGFRGSAQGLTQWSAASGPGQTEAPDRGRGPARVGVQRWPLFGVSGYTHVCGSVAKPRPHQPERYLLFFDNDFGNFTLSFTRSLFRSARDLGDEQGHKCRPPTRTTVKWTRHAQRQSRWSALKRRQCPRSPEGQSRPTPLHAKPPSAHRRSLCGGYAPNRRIHPGARSQIRA